MAITAAVLLAALLLIMVMSAGALIAIGLMAAYDYRKETRQWARQWLGR